MAATRDNDNNADYKETKQEVNALYQPYPQFKAKHDELIALLYKKLSAKDALRLIRTAHGEKTSGVNAVEDELKLILRNFKQKKANSVESKDIDKTKIIANNALFIAKICDCYIGDSDKDVSKFWETLVPNYHSSSASKCQEYRKIFRPLLDEVRRKYNDRLFSGNSVENEPEIKFTEDHKALPKNKAQAKDIINAFNSSILPKIKELYTHCDIIKRVNYSLEEVQEELQLQNNHGHNSGQSKNGSTSMTSSASTLLKAATSGGAQITGEVCLSALFQKTSFSPEIQEIARALSNLYYGSAQTKIISALRKATNTQNSNHQCIEIGKILQSDITNVALALEFNPQTAFPSVIAKFLELGGKIAPTVTILRDETGQFSIQQGTLAFPANACLYPICLQGKNRSQFLWHIANNFFPDGSFKHIELPFGAKESVDPYILPVSLQEQRKNENNDDPAWIAQSTAYEYVPLPKEPHKTEEDTFAKLNFKRMPRAQEKEILKLIGADSQSVGDNSKADTKQHEEHPLANPQLAQKARDHMSKHYYGQMINRENSYVVTYVQSQHIVVYRLVEEGEKLKGFFNRTPLKNITICPVSTEDLMHPREQIKVSTFSFINAHKSCMTVNGIKAADEAVSNFSSLPSKK